uniref:Uncharacterized protein n=1 Tax=Myotis myotis TaxID=51298 RepID=A0A7J7XZW1_MYOMY|nr:hypothetical protein mMyoMyo1_011305 [Myotis myotis]
MTLSTSCHQHSPGAAVSREQPRARRAAADNGLAPRPLPRQSHSTGGPVCAGGHAFTWRQPVPRGPGTAPLSPPSLVPWSLPCGLQSSHWEGFEFRSSTLPRKGVSEASPTRRVSAHKRVSKGLTERRKREHGPRSTRLPPTPVWEERRSSLIYFNIFLLISERKEEGEAGTSMLRENHGSAASCTPHTGDRARNLGTCPDQEPKPDLLVHMSTLSQLSHAGWVTWKLSST